MNDTGRAEVKGPNTVLRRYVLLMGSALSLLTFFTGLINQWVRAGWVGPLLIGGLAAVLFGAVGPVGRDRPAASRQVLTITLASAVVIGPILVIGRNHPPAYVAALAAVLILVVWALGAWWVGR